MPEVEEVFRMATQKVRPDPGALDRQNRGQRRRNNRRKASVYTLVACLALAAALMGASALRDRNHTIVHQPTPPPPVPGLYTVDVGSGELTPFPGLRAGFRFVFSADGSQVAFEVGDTLSQRQIVVMDADGRDRHQITHDPLGAGYPAWSLDGSMISYSELSGRDPNICIVDLLSDRITKVTHQTGTRAWGPSWSIHGDEIAYVQGVTNATLRIADVASGKSRMFLADSRRLPRSQRGLSAAAWSPLGTTIAYTRRNGNDREIWLIPTNGVGAERLVTSGYPATRPLWSPDGSRIAYTGLDQGKLSVFILDVATGIVQHVAPGTADSWVDNKTIFVEVA